MVGERISNYQIVRKLGEGGMGVVYEALNEEIDRRVAIKVLHENFSKDEELSQRFVNEARAANLIDHPGIVSVSETGRLPGGAAYIVMELLQGESLRARLRRGRQSLEEVLRLSRQVASALSAAHVRRIVHRDLKPDNLMLVPDPDMPGGERVKVLDFGIAKLQEEHRRPGTTGFRTQTGTVMGTPEYMAPEQCRGAERVDDRADVYALGVMLYEMLSGTLPFRDKVYEAVIAMHIYEPPPPLEERVQGVPQGVLALTMRMLLKDPTGRPTMVQAAEQLGALWRQTGVIAPESLPPRPPSTEDAWAPTVTPGASGMSRPLYLSAPPTSSPPPSAPLGPGGPVAEAYAPASQFLGSSPPGTLSPYESRAPAGRPQGRRLALALAALAVLCGGGVVALLGRGRPGSVPAPAAAVAPSAVIRCQLLSEPPGAIVLGASDLSELGYTPFSAERTVAQGPLVLLVRRPGYQEQRVRLDPGSGCAAQVALSPLPPPLLPLPLLPLPAQPPSRAMIEAVPDKGHRGPQKRPPKKAPATSAAKEKHYEPRAMD